MDISSDQHNEAMAKFLVSRYERIVGVNVMGKEPCQYQSTLERIQTHDSDFFG
jgi:hypothetical protein